MKAQRRLRAEEDAAVEAWRPSFEIGDSEVVEIQQAFLSTWDGKLAPTMWLKHWLEHGDVAIGWGDEYRGVPAKLPCDRFGPDHHSVGRSVCARRDCTGCCFCIGVPLPVYLEIRILRPPVWRPGMVCERSALDPWVRDLPRWMTVDELEREISRAAASSRPAVPVPAYLGARWARDLPARRRAQPCCRRSTCGVGRETCACLHSARASVR